METRLELSRRMDINAATAHRQLSESDLSATAAAFMFFAASAIFVALMCCYYSCHSNEKRRALGSGPPPLPVVPYARARGSSAGCVVCLGEFEEGEGLKVIPQCGHVFHPPCIDRWLAANRSCPVCRCSQIFEEKLMVREAEESVDVARD